MIPENNTPVHTDGDPWSLTAMTPWGHGVDGVVDGVPEGVDESLHVGLHACLR